MQCACPTINQICNISNIYRYLTKHLGSIPSRYDYVIIIFVTVVPTCNLDIHTDLHAYVPTRPGAQHMYQRLNTAVLATARLQHGYN